MPIYIVQVREDGETFEYEYGNLTHARQHYNQEKRASLLEYQDGNYYFIENKSE